MTRPAWEPWPPARASRNWDGGADRGARAPRRWRPGGGTWCAASTRSCPPRAAWRGPVPALRPRSARSAAPAGPDGAPARSRPGPASRGEAPWADADAGTDWRERLPARCTPERSPPAGPAPQSSASVVLDVVEVLHGDPQDLPSFFLDVEEQFH